MSASKPQTSSYLEDKRFLENSCTSEDKFVKEYKKFYYGKANSKGLYHHILTELENALVAGNISNFKRLTKAIGYINRIESRETLNTFYNDIENPIEKTNLVILACKHIKVDILKYVFNNTNILENLSVNVGKDAIVPADRDEFCHDAFYYAIRSGNIELLGLLIEKWPGDYFATRSEELDEVLSRAYEELKLKNVSLSESVEIFVENKLINLRFYSDCSSRVYVSVKDRVKNIKQRVDLVIEKIRFLKSNYSNVKLDEKFLFVARFIAKNIDVLKRQLKLTYDVLPWEEIQFCLISFISSHSIQQDINLFYRTILNKNEMLRYLESFANKLENEIHIVENMNVDRLADTPKLNRDLVVENIIRCNPEFKQLYEDYQKIRDVHSLQKISEYLNLALSSDPKERIGQLIIIRALQVIGEYLKNTLESPKMSNSTSELLIISLPKNTRKVIIDLRNSLSHANSLSKRVEIEENIDPDFFIGVQNDTKRIDNVITEILYNNKMKMIQKLLIDFIHCKSPDEMQQVADILKNVELDKISSVGFKMIEHENIEKLIREMSEAIPEKTNEETEFFDKIKILIDSIKTRSEIGKTTYREGFESLNGLVTDFYLRQCSTETLQLYANNSLVLLFGQKDEKTGNLEEIAKYCFEILRSASSRLLIDALDIVRRSAFEILYIAEFESNDIKWIEKLKEKVCEKDCFTPAHKQNKSHSGMSEDEYNKQLALKLSELKTILNVEKVSSKSIENLPVYRKNKKLQAAVEMLVLDIMSILGTSNNYLENNLLFIDDNAPLLTGKSLRNHLAHGNSLLDILLIDPSMAVILNAEKLVSENIVHSVKKFGKLVRDDPSKLKNKYDQYLIAVTNQQEMFKALQEGNLEKSKECLANGADINARSINSWSALHFASCGHSLDVVKFVFEDGNVTDVNGQTPLHIAAAHGRANIIEYFITKAHLPVDITDKDKRTPLHLAAVNGHPDAVQVLLKYNAKPNISVGFRGFTALHYAIENNHADVAKILLEKEANVAANEILDGCTLLHTAAESGCLDVVHLLLERGANVDAKRDKGAVPLHPASIKGHLEIVKALILKGANVNARTLDGCTPLLYATQFVHPEIVDFLLEHGADVNIADKNDRWTPLHYAIKKGRQEIVENLIKHKANIHIIDVEGKTLLYHAVRIGSLEISAVLIKHGINIHARNNNHLTALHCAARYDQKEIAQLLINSGAEVDCKGQDNLTPLHMAALLGHYNVADLLIKNRANVNAKSVYGSTPLYAAAQTGYIKLAELLVKNKAEVDAIIDNGQTPLHIACCNGHKDVAVFLIKHGAQLKRKCHNDLTPLHAAINSGHKDIIEFLINNGAEINAKGYFSCSALNGKMLPATPLEIAVEFEHVEVVDILAKNGADVNVKLGKRTPLLSAIMKNNEKMVEVLIANGADLYADEGIALSSAVFNSNLEIVEILLQSNARIDLRGAEGATLLFLAVTRGHKGIVTALIAKGANVNAVPKEGLTPLFIAARDGREEIAEILIENSTDINFACVSGTPLHAAVSYGHTNLVNILLGKGANIAVKDSESRTPLEIAVARGHLQVVEILLQHKNMNLNTKTKDGWTILHYASLENNLKMVKYLVDKGCNIDVKDNFGAKPIHIAAKEGCKDIVEFFLALGLDVDETGADNQTLLHYAAMNDRLNVINFLISKGSNVNARDDKGSTSLHYAAMWGFKEVILALLENGAVYNPINKLSLRPIDMTDSENIITVDRSTGRETTPPSNPDVQNLFMSTTLLFEAVKSDNASEVERLIKLGAFVNAKNTDTETTPLHYAASKGSNQIVDILLENKANANATCSKLFTPLHYAAKFSHFKCVISLLHHGAIYNAVSSTGKTPLDFSDVKNITDLIKLIDDSFKKVERGRDQVIQDLDKITDHDILKAVMNASNTKLKTLISSASHKLAEKLKRLSQGNVSAQLDKATQLLTVGDYQQAISIYKRLFEKRKQLFGPDNPAALEMQMYIGQALYKQGNYQAAVDLLREIFRKQKDILGLDNKDTLETRFNIALVLYRQNKYDEASSILQEVYEKQKNLLGPHHPSTLNTHAQSANLLQAQGKYEEAMAIYRAMHTLYKCTLGEFDTATVGALNNIGSMLSHQGKSEEALKIYRDVLEKKKKLLGRNHIDTLRTLHNIGGVLKQQGKHEEALKVFLEVLDAQRKTPNHPDLLNTLYIIAEEYVWLGKIIMAHKFFKECYERNKAIHGPNHPVVLCLAEKVKTMNKHFLLDGRQESDIAGYLQTDINLASSNGDVQLVKSLLESGAEANERDIDGRTPLHFAISNGHVNVMNVLLENGADPTSATNKGNTPLHTAVLKNDSRIVQILLKHVNRDKLNGFVNAKTTSGGASSLHVAAKNGYLDVVKLLLKHGATYDIQNKEGKTPIDLSSDQKTISFLKLTDDVFKNVKKGSPEATNKLKAMKPDEFSAVANARNAQGHSLMQVALISKQKSIANVLLTMLKKSKEN